MNYAKGFLLVLLIPMALFAAWCPKLKADEKEEFLQEIRKAHALLEQKILQNIRVEEVLGIYKNGQFVPERYQNYLGSPNAFLVKAGDLKDGKGIQERIAVTRSDGRFSIGKRESGEYLLGGVSNARAPLEGTDLTFIFTFPFCSLWTSGKLTDFLANNTKSFKVKRENQEIEIDISPLEVKSPSPFDLSPLKVIVDSKTYAIKMIKGRRAMSGRYAAIEAVYKNDFPESVTIKGGPTPEALSIIREHKFPVFQTETVGSNAFSLSQFGIPEPNAAFKNPWFTIPRFLWLLVAGFICIGAFFVGRRILKPG